MYHTSKQEPEDCLPVLGLNPLRPPAVTPSHTSPPIHGYYRPYIKPISVPYPI